MNYYIHQSQNAIRIERIYCNTAFVILETPYNKIPHVAEDQTMPMTKEDMYWWRETTRDVVLHTLIKWMT